MKIRPTVKKALFAFIVLLLMAVVYGAIIALCNQYLREHEMLTKYTKFMLSAFMFLGYYFIYRWFSKRLDEISYNKK